MTQSDDPNQVSDTEKYVRLSSDILGGIGGGLLTAFGAGAAVQPIQEAKGQALDAGFGTKAKKIDPRTDVRQALKEGPAPSTPQPQNDQPANPNLGNMQTAVNNTPPIINGSFFNQPK